MKRLFLLLLSLSLLLCACGTKTEEPEVSFDEAEPVVVDQTDDIFAINYNSQDSMNPYSTTNSLNQIAGGLVYEQLIQLDDSFQPQPGLLSSWTTEDGTVWTLQPDTSRLFHDGHALTADDVVYSINTARESELYTARLRNITDVAANEEGAVVVTLDRANTQFPALLAIPVIENNAMSYNYPSGTGPYRYDESDSTTLVAFGDYPNAKDLPIDKIYLREYSTMEDVINAFDNSDLDLVCNDPSGESDLSFSSVSESRQFNTTNLQYIAFNTASRFFSNPEYRRAFQTAVDRAYAVSLLSDCAVASALPVHPASPYFDETLVGGQGYDMSLTASALTDAKVLDYDADGEREYLASEGSTEATELNLSLLVCSDNKQKTAVCNKLASDLAQIGVTVTVNAVPWEDYLAALNIGNFDFYYGELRLTADFDLTPLLVPGGSVNYGDVTNPIYSEAINAYLAAPSDTREDACRAMLSTILDNAPILPVCFEKQEVCAHRGIVGGLAPTQSNIFQNMPAWVINLK
ncbi:MAG: ABC transporter substrate-binding protein [Oscillospiraceae bacterium]|nr:ABC transporter substrate-binding protein [Oscillospiraceae bacterium]